MSWRCERATPSAFRSEARSGVRLCSWHLAVLLEHVPDPLSVVQAMVQAVVLGGPDPVPSDDDHDVLRLWPEPAGFMALWQAYIRTYDRLGNDPYIGRRWSLAPRGRGGAKLQYVDLLLELLLDLPIFPMSWKISKKSYWECARSSSRQHTSKRTRSTTASSRSEPGTNAPTWPSGSPRPGPKEDDPQPEE